MFTASRGQEFIFGVIQSYSASYITVNIAAAKPGKVWINAPAVGIDRHYLIHSGTRQIMIPTNIVQNTNNSIENKSIHLLADTDISVNVINYGAYSREGFLALPVSNFSHRYVIPTAKPSDLRYPSEMLIAASTNSTKVSILFPEDLTGKSITNNTVIITLNKYQTYLYKSKYDLSGTYIESSAPISVVAGTEYTATPSSASYGSVVMEQIPSEEYFGEHFIVPPLFGRTGYMIKILAVDDHILTTLQNKSGTYQFMIYRGLPITVYSENDPVFISSQRPILVVQHALSYGVDHIGSDFSMIVPSISNFMKRYYFLVSNLDAATNFICVTLPTTMASDLLLDSSPLSAVNTSHTTTTEGNFTVLTTNVSSGRHSITSKGSTIMFGALLYGHNSKDGFGFPLGMKIKDGECSTTTQATMTVEMSRTTELLRPITGHTLTTGSGKRVTSSERPILNGTGLYCFDCQEVSHLYLCNTVKRCQSSELCSVAQFTTTNGYVKYRSGCLNEQICPASKYRRNTHPVDCVECCTGHFCNNHGCDGPGLPDRSSRGPLCFDCQHVESVEECGTVTLCHHDQVCSIQEFLWGDRYRHFNMGCSSNQCIPTKRSTPMCENCCTQDFCNQSCTKAPPVTIVG